MGAHTRVIRAVQHGRAIRVGDVRRANVPVKCTEVDVSLISRHFDDEAWGVVSDTVVAMRRDAVWLCASCEQVLDTGPSIGCAGCLDWCHMKCARIARKPVKKFWFCGAGITSQLRGV